VANLLRISVDTGHNRKKDWSALHGATSKGGDSVWGKKKKKKIQDQKVKKRKPGKWGG